MKRLFTLALAGIVMALSVGCSQIDTGNVGVSRFGGKTNLEELSPGLSVTWFANVDEVTTKEVLFPIRDMKPKSKDNLTISDLDVDIYIKIDPSKVAETMVKYQGDVVPYRDLVKQEGASSDYVVGPTKVIREARETIYRVASRFDATTMHTKRDEVAAEIAKGLQAELNASDTGTWIVTSVNVSNLVTDPAIEKAIRENVERDLEIAAANKLKALRTAQGDAAVEMARKEAEANGIISASLSDKLIRLREIEAQKAFAGQGTHTVVLPQGQGSLVNIGK